MTTLDQLENEFNMLHWTMVSMPKHSHDAKLARDACEIAAITCLTGLTCQCFCPTHGCQHFKPDDAQALFENITDRAFSIQEYACIPSFPFFNYVHSYTRVVLARRR